MTSDLDDVPRTAPPRKPTLVNYLHSAVAIPLIYFYTAVMGTLSLLLSLRDPEGRKQHWCASIWSRMIVRTVGASVRVCGAENIRAGESYVFLFPEGTRTRDGSLQPFKKGGFRVALQTGLSVVPVTIVGTRQVLPRDSFVFRPGPVLMHLDAPIPTAGLDDRDLPALMQKVRDAMTKHFKEGMRAEG